MSTPIPPPPASASEPPAMTPLRPLSIGELLDVTFSLYRRHFLLFVGLVALPYLVVLPLQILNILVNQGRFLLTFNSLSLVFVITIASLAATAASQAGTVMAVSDVYLGRSATVMRSLSSVRDEIGGVAILMIVTGILALLGAILCIVPGIILVLMWSLSVPAMVLEGRTIGDAMSRSVDLTKGSRGRILAIYVLFVVITMLITFLFAVPVTIANVVVLFRNGASPSALETVPGWLLAFNTITSFVTHCLAGPLMTIAFSVLYYDVRVRKEAFDLQLMMAAIDSKAGGSPGNQAGA